MSSIIDLSTMAPHRSGDLFAQFVKRWAHDAPSLPRLRSTPNLRILASNCALTTLRISGGGRRRQQILLHPFRPLNTLVRPHV